MMGIFGTKQRRDAEPDPPRRADFGDDEHAYLTCHLIWQCGGKERLTPDRLEIAALCAGLMIDMRSARAGDLVRHADVLERLMARLPLSRTLTVPEIVTDNMSLEDMSRLYGRLCGDPDIEVFENVKDVTPSAPVPIAPTPQKPTDAPAMDAPRSQDSTPSEPDGPAYVPPDRDGGASTPPTAPPAAPEGARPAVRGGFNYDRANATGFTSMQGLMRDRWGGGR